MKLNGPISQLVLLLLVLPVLGQATSLTDYRERIEAAHIVVDRLIDPEADMAVLNREAAAIRRLLPAEERIDAAGGSVAVSNAWLHSQLDQLLAETDPVKRTYKLTEIKERLEGIAIEVNEIENAAGATNNDEKNKVNEILQRPEYQKAAPPEESLFERWRRSIQEWLDRVFPTPAETPSTVSGLAGLKFWLQALVYAVVIALIGFLLYRFVPFFNLSFSDRKKRAKDERVILGERVGPDETAADLFAQAEKLATSGDLRGAIRRGYMALLCELADRKVIGLARHKTNRDYLRDLSKRNDILPNVRIMTSGFERSWYGLRTAESREWDEFRAKYRETVASIK